MASLHQFGRISVSRSPLSCRFMRLWFCLYWYTQEKIGLFWQQTRKRYKLSTWNVSVRYWEFAGLTSSVMSTCRHVQVSRHWAKSWRPVACWFGHIARLESDVSAHMVVYRHIDMSVGRPPCLNWRRRPGRPRARWIDQIQRDSSSSPVELQRRAIRCVAMLLERCNGPRRLCDIDDDDDKPLSQQPTITGLSLAVCKCDALIYYRNYVTWMCLTVCHESHVTTRLLFTGSDIVIVLNRALIDTLCLLFIARQHTDTRYWYSKSVFPSARYVPVPDENGLTYRHSFFHHTVAQLF